MLFDSVGVAEDRRLIWGQGEGATNRRPSRFPNEIAKTAPNLPRMLHAFLFNKACRKAVRYYRWFVFVLFRVIYNDNNNNNNNNDLIAFPLSGYSMLQMNNKYIIYIYIIIIIYILNSAVI